MNLVCVSDVRLVRAFVKLRKANIVSSCLSVCLYVCPLDRPSVRVEQLGSNWTDFNEIWYFMGFIKSFEKIQCLLKSHSKNGYFK